MDDAAVVVVGGMPTGVHMPQSDKPKCGGGCGFFGAPENGGFCSKCFGDRGRKRQAEEEAVRPMPTPQQQQQRLNPGCGGVPEGVVPPQVQQPQQPQQPGRSTALTQAAFSMGGWKPPWMQGPSVVAAAAAPPKAPPREPPYAPPPAGFLQHGRPETAVVAPTTSVIGENDFRMPAAPAASTLSFMPGISSQHGHLAAVSSTPSAIGVDDFRMPGTCAAAMLPFTPGSLSQHHACRDPAFGRPEPLRAVFQQGNFSQHACLDSAVSRPEPFRGSAMPVLSEIPAAPQPATMSRHIPETFRGSAPAVQSEIPAVPQPRHPGIDPAFGFTEPLRAGAEATFQPPMLGGQACPDPASTPAESKAYVFTHPDAGTEKPKQRLGRRNSGYTSSIPDVTKAEALPPLSAQQQLVVEMVLRKQKNIFFTGSAGTGKSRTLKDICKQGPLTSTKITALTGIAASILPGGTTLHSFAGIGLGKGSNDQILNQLMNNGAKCKMWRSLKLLVVDEASMMSKKLFEALEYVARKVRKDERPFGGVQLCLCGDFFQLPPVARSGGDESKFCFESPVWDKCIDASIELTTVYRQRDEQFLRLLREVRFNATTAESINLLQRLSRPLDCPPGMLPTRLYPVNSVADNVNAQELSKLPGASFMFTANDIGPEHLREQLNNLTMFPKNLELKVGAQVMMLMNKGDLVNGSRGVVVDFMESGLASMPLVPKVKWLSGAMTQVNPEDIEREVPMGKLRRSQIPLKLCWAMTIHKSQGMSIDLLEVDLARVFEKGQAYVALSRARTLEGLRVCSFDPSKFWVDQRVVDFYGNQVKPVEEVHRSLAT